MTRFKDRVPDYNPNVYITLLGAYMIVVKTIDMKRSTKREERGIGI
jgi:hypothetical protein